MGILCCRYTADPHSDHNQRSPNPLYKDWVLQLQLQPQSLLNTLPVSRCINFKSYWIREPWMLGFALTKLMITATKTQIVIVPQASCTGMHLTCRKQICLYKNRSANPVWHSFDIDIQEQISSNVLQWNPTPSQCSMPDTCTIQDSSL